MPLSVAVELVGPVEVRGPGGLDQNNPGAGPLNEPPSFVIAIAVVAGVIKLIALLDTCLLRVNQLDFGSYYESAYAMRIHIDPYTSDLTALGNRLGVETGSLIHSAYTPPFLLFFQIFTFLPPTLAYWIWTTLNLSLLLIAVYLLVKNRPGISPRIGLLLAAMTFTFEPVQFNFYWGQTQVIVLFLLVLAMRAMEVRRDGLAGLALATAGLLRAYPLLLLFYLLVRGKRRVFVSAIAGVLGGIVITLVAFGFSRCISFRNGAAWATQMDVTRFAGIDMSVGAFTTRVFWKLFGGNLSPQLSLVRFLVTSVLTLLMVYTAVRLTPGPDQEDRDWRAFSLWIVTAIIVAPISWPHYEVLLLIPFVQIAAAANLGRARGSTVWIALSAYCLCNVAQALMPQVLTGRFGFINVHLPWLAEVLKEPLVISLVLAYAAVYLFAVDRPAVSAFVRSAGSGANSALNTMVAP